MKIKIIFAALLVALTGACAPATTALPTETAAPTQTASSIPPTATFVPTSTQTPTAVVPTSTPTSTLSAEGPWLMYVHNSPNSWFGDGGPPDPEFILVNQDGSSRASVTLSEDQVDTFLMERNSANYMAHHDGGLYIFRPGESTGRLIHRCLRDRRCISFFTGDEKGGLLATTYLAEGEDVPELIIYELPDGNIRYRFPLVQCGENDNVCNQYRSNWKEMGWQEPQWSPNGRYLAFAAVIDADSSDMFVYDMQDGNLRRLTHGPDWVGQIEWSPDGTHIVMQELLNDSEFFFAPYAKPPSSVWSVSMSTNEIKLLYSIENATTEQTILLWLDNQRFVAYDGYLFDANHAVNLRLVDREAGTNRILFNGAFGTLEFDPIHRTFALYVLYHEQYEQGVVLVSIDNPGIRRLETTSDMGLPDWDPETGLFLSESECENEPQSLMAFDYQGNFRCVPKPTPTPETSQTASFPSPDGKWTLSMKDGLWLETEGTAPVQVSQEMPTDIIWCPDSSCFFYSVLQQNEQQPQWTLYHASLPDLTIKMVDDGIESEGTYQWLGGEE